MEDDGDAVRPTSIKDGWGEAVRVKSRFPSCKVGIVEEVNDRAVFSRRLSKDVVLPWRFKTSCSTVVALAGRILASGGKRLFFESLLRNESEPGSGIF